MLKKKAVVIHSGGMDSSLCLALAAREFGPDHVLGLSFRYQQRHSQELEQAALICKTWNIDHAELNIDCLAEITENALTRPDMAIQHEAGYPPNTLVVGRNGLMAWLGSVHAHHLGAQCIYLGVMELEAANSGYRDCSRTYMDALQSILRLDLDSTLFEIRTPLVKMTKLETLQLADSLEIVEFLIEQTITCYEGQFHPGCRMCPACILRNQGIQNFQKNKAFSNQA